MSRTLVFAFHIQPEPVCIKPTEARALTALKVAQPIPAPFVTLTIRRNSIARSGDAMPNNITNPSRLHSTAGRTAR